MQKKSVLICILSIISIMCLFSQDIERITYMDIGPDGSQRINRTVNAIFIGWMQKEVRQEGNLRAVYEAFCLVDGEWSEWSLGSRRPMQRTLNQEYDLLLREYVLLPNTGAILQIEGMNVLQLFSVPSGKTSPFWWSTSGNSFYSFYKLYIVK